MSDFLNIKGLSKEEFFSNYWRKKPLHIRKCGCDFNFSIIDFENTSVDLDYRKPEYVKKGGGGVVFLQNINLVSEAFASRCKKWNDEYGLVNTWFDSVRTLKGSCGGIGSHYDDSDNFVFQLEGKKKWRLHSPSIIPIDEIRRRMLGEAGVGTFPMPEASVEFLLEPGDLLYIPLFWLHEGISSDDSLSISLVCNTNNAIRTLLPILTSMLSNVDLWWGAIPDFDKNDDKMSLNIFNELFEVIDNKEFREILCEKWIDTLHH